MTPPIVVVAPAGQDRAKAIVWADECCRKPFNGPEDGGGKVRFWIIAQAPTPTRNEAPAMSFTRRKVPLWSVPSMKRSRFFPEAPG
jgi:hypothetical protein